MIRTRSNSNISNSISNISISNISSNSSISNSNNSSSNCNSNISSNSAVPGGDGLLAAAAPRQPPEGRRANDIVHCMLLVCSIMCV